MPLHNYDKARDLLRQAKEHQSDVQNFIELSVEEAARGRTLNGSKYKNLAWEASGRRKKSLEEAAGHIGLEIEPGVLPDGLERQIEDSLELIEIVLESRDQNANDTR